MTDELPEWACKRVADLANVETVTNYATSVEVRQLASMDGWLRAFVKHIAATEDGLSHLRRLTERYDFRSEAGPLANCVDYIEAVRCFEGLTTPPETTEKHDG